MFDNTLTFICSHFSTIALVLWVSVFLLISFFTGCTNRKEEVSLGFITLASGVIAVGMICLAIVLLLMWEVVVTTAVALLLYGGVKVVSG